MVASIGQKRDQLADHVVHNMPKRGQAIAGNSRKVGLAIETGRGATSTVKLPLTSPTPPWVYKHARQPAATECSQWQHSAYPLLLQVVSSPCRRYLH